MMTIDLSVALAGLNRLASANMSPWLVSVGKREQAAIQARIKAGKKAPDDEPWSPWKPSTEHHRNHKGNAERGLLYDEGTLLASILYAAGPDEVVIGTPVAYAGYLQDGTPRMDARPFAGWSDADLVALEVDAVAFLEALL